VTKGTQRWSVGGLTVTSVVEEQTDHVPPEFFLPQATAAAVSEHQWLVPHFADVRGRIGLRIQAFVIEGQGRKVLVDPCVGNGKTRSVPFWNQQSWPFMERFAEAGFAPESIDAVVHTHLHADHVGWDTTFVEGAWAPTFAGARYLYTKAELAWCRAVDPPGFKEAFDDSIGPVLDAGLADEVDDDADLGGGLRLEPSPGHTPGHVSLWIESAGETALVTGDFIHHPVQCAQPDWAEVADTEADEARATRRRMLAAAADRRALVLGTHFPSRPAGRIVAERDAWRFVPVDGVPVRSA
jgi:glyoxylase-like metal-dependent hydrolase (beta-lactamase superfamily II)